MKENPEEIKSKVKKIVLGGAAALSGGLSLFGAFRLIVNQPMSDQLPLTHPDVLIMIGGGVMGLIAIALLVGPGDGSGTVPPPPSMNY